MTLLAGIYHDIPADRYHRDDLCDAPSLSSGMIKRLLTGSAKEAAAYHPRLSQWPELPAKEATKAQDLGTIGHARILRTPCDFRVVKPEDAPVRTDKGQPYRNWSGKAKAWKDEQKARGILFVSEEEDANVRAAVESMETMLRKEYGTFPIGPTEQTVIWQRETDFGKIWCRARVDVLGLEFMTLLDPKFTDVGIGNFALDKKVKGERLDIQATFYTQGVQATAESLRGDVDDRLDFRFPVAEINPPFQSRWLELPDWQYTAEADIEWACNLFAKCLRSGEWPGYDGVYRPPCPSYLQIAAEERRNAQASSFSGIR